MPGAAVTVKAIRAEEDRLPEVPVTEIVAGPVSAVLLAVRVKILEPVVGLVPKDAVTPLGRPEAARVTLLPKPLAEVTTMVSVTLFP